MSNRVRIVSGANTPASKNKVRSNIAMNSQSAGAYNEFRIDLRTQPSTGKPDSKRCLSRVK
jgi:hypothetical protein